LVDTHLPEEEKPESVEADAPGRPAMWLGCPATSYCKNELSKSVEVPFTTINTPLTVIVDTTHSFCSYPLVKVLISSSAGEVLLGVESQVESSLELRR
jgi:hypothetical protein